MATISHTEALVLRWEYVVENDLSNGATDAQYRRMRAVLGARAATSCTASLNRWISNSFDADEHPLDFSTTLPYARALELLDQLRQMQHARGLTRGEAVFLPHWMPTKSAWMRRVGIDPEVKELLEKVTSLRGSNRYYEGSAYKLQRLMSDTGLLDAVDSWTYFLRLLGDQWENQVDANDASLVRRAYTYDIRLLGGEDIDTSDMPTLEEAIAAENEYRNQGSVQVVSSFSNRQGSQQIAIMIDVATNPRKLRLLEDYWKNNDRNCAVSRNALSDAFYLQNMKCYVSNCICHGDEEEEDQDDDASIVRIIASPIYNTWDHATAEAVARKRLERRQPSGRVITPAEYNQDQMNRQRARNDMLPVCWFSHKITEVIRRYRTNIAPDEMVTSIGEDVPHANNRQILGVRIFQQLKLYHAMKLMDICAATRRRIDPTNFPGFDRHHGSGKKNIRVGDYIIETRKMINPSDLPALSFASVADFLSAHFGERATTMPLECRLHKLWTYIEAHLEELRELGVVTLPYDFEEVDGVFVYTGELSDVGVDMDMLRSNAVNGVIRLPRTRNALEVLNQAPQDAEEDDSVAEAEVIAPVAPVQPVPAAPQDAEEDDSVAEVEPIAPAAPVQPVPAAAQDAEEDDSVAEVEPIAPIAQVRQVEVDESENSSINVLQVSTRAGGKRVADQISSKDEEDEPSPVAQPPAARPPAAQPNLVVRRRNQRSSFMERATRHNPNLVTRSNIPARQPLEQRPNHQPRLVYRPVVPTRQPLVQRGTRFVSPVVMN